MSKKNSSTKGKSTNQYNGVYDIGVNAIQRMEEIDTSSKRPHFTIFSKFSTHKTGVVFINPLKHLTKDGESGVFVWRGNLARYQRPRTRDSVFLGLVETFKLYFLAIKDGASPEEVSHLLPAAPIILATEPDKTIRTTNKIPIADGATRSLALHIAALEVDVDPDTVVPLPCHVYEGYSVEEMAGKFVDAQKTRNMNINDAIHAATINGQFDPVISLIRDSEKRGLFGQHVVVSSKEEYRKNPNAILLGNFLEWLCWGAFNRSSKKDIFSLSNEVSAKAVDNLAKMTKLFTETIGRKKLSLTTNHRGHCLDSVVFMCVLSRICLANPISEKKKKGYITEDELKYWLKDLITSNHGSSFRLYFDHCKLLCSAGKRGMSELNSQIISKGITIGVHPNNKFAEIRLNQNIPCSFRYEMIRNGKKSPLYKPTGVRRKVKNITPTNRLKVETSITVS